MTVTIRVPNWRSVALVLTGAALAAALLAPVTSGVTTYTRSASCAGLGFFPDMTAHYSHQGPYRTREDSGYGFFLCDPGLPSGAVVTKVEFTVRDSEGIGEVRNCALFRSALAPPVGVFEVLAAVASTGTVAAPGTVRLADTTISYSTIDNTQYGYFLQCEISGFVNGIGGADVIYKITAAKG